MTEPTEVWRPVYGSDGKYQVSSTGRVRGPQGCVLKPARLGDLYLAVSVRQFGRRRVRRVHILVAEAFRGPRPPGHVARHLNGDSFDNRAKNITWGTLSDNAFDRVAHGHDRSARKIECDYGHEFTPENTYLPPGSYRRICRECVRRRGREYQARKALARARH